MSGARPPWRHGHRPRRMCRLAPPAPDPRRVDLHHAVPRAVFPLGRHVPEEPTR